jgi:hypothetical protein
MAKIVDPDDLNQGTEVTITPGASGTIQLNIAGNLSSDGATGQAIYSFLKEEWKDDGTLIKYPFPMTAITEESFEMINDWDWANDATRLLVRDAGWAWKNAAGTSRTEYANITTLGNFTTPATETAYYIQVSAGDFPVDFNLAGPTNQAVKIYGNVDNGNFDYRDFFKIFLREYQRTYDSYDLLSEQNLTALTYKKYAMPLANASDSVKITHTDAVVSAAGGDYGNIDITYYDTPQAKTVGGVSRNFHIIIEADGKTKEQVYEKVQYLLRQPGNINENYPTTIAVSGSTADELLNFVGDTLYCQFASTWATPSHGGGGGVYINNYAAADTNSLVFIDDTGTAREELYTATGRMTFNTNLLNDTDAYYWMFYTSVPSGDYGTANAIIVDDYSSVPISGSITLNPSITAGNDYIDFTYDFDFNTQGGRNKDTAAHNATTIVCIGLETAQFVSTTTLTLARTKTNNVSIVAALERNYIP